ncbi:MAG TPA: deoxyribose-phosphate aldolase [Gemmatimonadaceae bacterium]|nr:deoxyribose-phosphate aldolase [Gemmatimonadaceae bacterium]
MTEINRLAQRIAEELARRDVARSALASSSGAVSTSPAPASASRFPLPASRSSRIADYIDHTLLKPEATAAEIDKLCDEAKEHRFAAVCVNPVWVARCVARLKGSGVKVATVIGFPLGASMPEIKAAEAKVAVEQGADELDMVAAIGHIKSGDWQHVARDIESVVRAASGRVVKVILESALLSPLDIVKASALAREMGAGFVKTSTGFSAAGGATAEAVALMRLAVGDALGVKASGGVRDCETALRMIAAGASRIGTSSGVAMTQCLGPGPLPLAELLAAPHAHGVRCTSGQCSSEPAAAQPY